MSAIENDALPGDEFGVRAAIQTTRRLTRKEIRAASAFIQPEEIIKYVKLYYKLQDDRKRNKSQALAVRKIHEARVQECIAQGIELPPLEEAPSNPLINFLGEQAAESEAMIKNALDDYTANHPLGVWLREIDGIGPVTSAGLLAWIDIEKAPTVGHIWSFAGLDPQVKWEKGQLRPWAADLKKLCYFIGEGFVKTSSKESAIYGHLYKEKKAWYDAKNKAGDYAKEAAEGVLKYDKSTDAYKACLKGELPQAQIHARARRYAVKIFLSHFHQVWYEWHYGIPAPVPFPIQFLGHTHKINPPTNGVRLPPNPDVMPAPHLSPSGVIVQSAEKPKKQVRGRTKKK